MTDTDPERGDRIAKFLARAGVASRRDVEKMLAEGRIKLNNAPVTHPATFVAAGDLVQVDGKIVGTLGVIGPMRMAYERVIPIVDITAKLLSSTLSQY